MTTLAPSKEKSNLTKAEARGKHWLVKQINAQKLFVTKADKGGATVLLDWDKAVDTIRAEMTKPNKFKQLEDSVEERMLKVKKETEKIVCQMEEKGNIDKKDRKIISGINEKGHKMHSHVFRSMVPYAYPLFKLHKLTSQQIEEKVIPPARLVHATKEGPLYRLEKWCSPYLTNISRDYCSEEFLLDTPDLLKQIEDLNNNQNLERKSLLFTLDVVSLYPSIQPNLAFQALADAFSYDRQHPPSTKEALNSFIDVILKSSFVTFEDKVYESNEGIPTGNCISRQIADCFMHWLIFKKLKHQLPLWNLIKMWKRFIDDILGRWYGTVRQFHMFVEQLNRVAAVFGIQFGDQQVGNEVNFLDTKLYLDSDGKIQYRLYKKETDARLYLKPTSFHPPHVFKSVVFSQMMRVIGRNSKPDTCTEDLEELKVDLMKSGHNHQTIEALEPRAFQRVIDNNNDEQVENQNRSSLVFSFKYFKDAASLKVFVKGIEPDIKQLCGDVRVICAERKHQSVGNIIVRNRRLSGGSSGGEDTNNKSQKCGARGCMTCPLLFEQSEVTINDKVCKLDMKLDCKSKNVIYIFKCQICTESNSGYIGQTVQEAHNRVNGHRSKFAAEEEIYKQSALSFHCQLEHPDKFELSIFKLGLIKQVIPRDLDREEDILIHRYRTHIWGLNRIEVVR